MHVAKHILVHFGATRTLQGIKRTQTVENDIPWERHR